jgi:hypothetical protein
MDRSKHSKPADTPAYINQAFMAEQQQKYEKFLSSAIRVWLQLFITDAEPLHSTTD